jgi:hypothetical protein
MVFGNVEWHEIGAAYAEGMYEGQKFVLTASGEEPAEVDGNFSDAERLFIFTQWEITA